MERRSFLKLVGGATGGLALNLDSAAAADAPHAAEEADQVAGVPRRVLGRTKRRVSIVGFPGLALVHHPQDRCNEAVHAAFAHGVNYFDVAPAYGDAETKMGIALQGLDRSKLFLACKTKKRDKAAAREELERSLKLAKTDHFDLYQLHHLSKTAETEQALGTGGAIEALVKAKEEGLVKHLGFSAHTTKAAVYALKAFAFDTVMFPINFVEFYLRGFGKEVLELANQQGAAVLAIKMLSRGLWPKDVEQTRKWWYRAVEEPHEVDLAVRFTLSQPSVVIGFPPAFVDVLDKALVGARKYQPITPAETEELRQLAGTCQSVFQREDSLARRTASPGPAFPHSPYDCDEHWA